MVVLDIGSTIIHPDLAVLTQLLHHKTLSFGRDRLARAFTYALEADMRTLPTYDDATRQGQEFLRLLDPLSVPDTTEAHDLWTSIHNSGGHGSRLYTELDPDAHYVLKALRSAGCQLVAASNSDGSLREELSAFELTHYFDHVVDSTHIGMLKPHEEFFHEILRLGAPRAFSWHVGNDLIRDALAPLFAGFSHAVLYDRADAYPGLVSRFRVRRLADLVTLVVRS
jgi:FMN phosphatase YigB (HAD superfamily)